MRHKVYVFVCFVESSSELTVIRKTNNTVPCRVLGVCNECFCVIK